MKRSIMFKKVAVLLVTLGLSLSAMQNPASASIGAGSADDGSAYTLTPAESASAVEIAKDLSFQLAHPPTKSKTPSTNLSVGGCGFLQSCVYFNQTDQRAIINGGSAAIAGLICIVGSPAACVVAAVIVAVAMTYLSDKGICSGGRRLRIGFFPKVGGNSACVS